MWKYIFSTILFLTLKSFSATQLELSPVELSIEVTAKRIEKKEELKAPDKINPFKIQTSIEILRYLPFIVDFSDGLPFLSIEKPKSYLGLPPSNALLSRAIDNFNSGSLIFAKNDLEEFLKKYPASPYNYYAYYLLGYVEYLRGSYVSAGDNLSKSCQLKPLSENCTSAAAVSLMIRDMATAKNSLAMADQESYDVKFLKEVIDFMDGKNAKDIKVECSRLNIAFVDSCMYSKKYLLFTSGDYRNSLKVQLNKENTAMGRQALMMDGWAYYFTKENGKASNLFDYYLKKVSIADNLSNLAYFGKALTAESLPADIAGVLQTRDEELAQQLYINIAKNHLQAGDYFNAFIYLQSALAVYDKNKEQILQNIAVCMYNLKNFHYAKGIFKELTKMSADPLVVLYTAFTHYNLKEYAEAEKHFQRLTDNLNFRETALEYLSNIYFSTKDYESFIETLSELKKLNQDKAYNLLGWYFFEKGDYKNAFKSFRDGYMKAVSAFNMGDNKTARELLEKQVGEKPRFLEAFVYLKENDVEKARNILEKIKDKDSRTSQEASYLYAFTYFMEGKFDAAVLEFKRFLNIYSSRDDDLTKKAFLRVADSYYNMGEVEIARKLYNDFISKYSNTKEAVDASYSLLQLETKDSKTDIKAAIESFINKHPDYALVPILKIQLANIYVNEGNLEEAEKLYREFIQKNIPESEIALYQYISMLYKKGDLEKAKKLCIDFINQYPNSENLTNIKILLAEIYERQNDIDKAISVYHQIQDVGQIKLKIAKLLIKKKEFNQALEHLQELYKKQPDDKSIALEIGKVYHQTSKNEEAVNHLQQATKSENPLIAAEGYYYLGILYKQKDLNKALNNLLNSIYINPQLNEVNVSARLEAAQILISAEKRKEASCLLKEVLKYNDDKIKQQAEVMMKDLPKCIY